MSKDYKNYIIKYLTEDIFNNWWNNKSNSDYRELLEVLGITTQGKVSEVFKGENHILKFFWYKLLTRKNMPANTGNRFDCDKVFFGKHQSFPPSNLVNEWQRRKECEGWKPDTANSYTKLFRRFLALFLPDIFPSTLSKDDSGEVRFKVEWVNNLLNRNKNRSADKSHIIEEKYKKLKECHSKISAYERKNSSRYDNQLRFFSFLILFQEELFQEMKDTCKEDELQRMRCFAKLTHTPGNFILVPKKDHYGNVKSNSYGDFIDLYVKHLDKEFEELIEEQKLSMYKEQLFEREGDKVFPYNKETFNICIDNINNKIIQREKELA